MLTDCVESIVLDAVGFDCGIWYVWFVSGFGNFSFALGFLTTAVCDDSWVDGISGWVLRSVPLLSNCK